MKFKDLEMHKVVNIGYCRIIYRVPGGIIYSEYDDESGDVIAYVFVPACQEFELEIPGTEESQDDH